MIKTSLENEARLYLIESDDFSSRRPDCHLKRLGIRDCDGICVNKKSLGLLLCNGMNKHDGMFSSKHSASHNDTLAMLKRVAVPGSDVRVIELEYGRPRIVGHYSTIV